MNLKKIALYLIVSVFLIVSFGVINGAQAATSSLEATQLRNFKYAKGATIMRYNTTDTSNSIKSEVLIAFRDRLHHSLSMYSYVGGIFTKLDTTDAAAALLADASQVSFLGYQGQYYLALTRNSDDSIHLWRKCFNAGDTACDNVAWAEVGDSVGVADSTTLSAVTTKSKGLFYIFLNTTTGVRLLAYGDDDVEQIGEDGLGVDMSNVVSVGQNCFFRKYSSKTRHSSCQTNTLFAATSSGQVYRAYLAALNTWSPYYSVDGTIASMGGNNPYIAFSKGGVMQVQCIMKGGVVNDCLDDSAIADATALWINNFDDGGDFVAVDSDDGVTIFDDRKAVITAVSEPGLGNTDNKTFVGSAGKYYLVTREQGVVLYWVS